MTGDLEEYTRIGVYQLNNAIRKLVDGTNKEIRDFIKSEFKRVAIDIRKVEKQIIEINDDTENYTYVRESSQHIWKRLIHSHRATSAILSRTGYSSITTSKLKHTVQAPSTIFLMITSEDKESRVLANGMLDAIYDRDSTGN